MEQLVKMERTIDPRVSSVDVYFYNTTSAHKAQGMGVKGLLLEPQNLESCRLYLHIYVHTKI